MPAAFDGESVDDPAAGDEVGGVVEIDRGADVAGDDFDFVADLNELAEFAAVQHAVLVKEGVDGNIFRALDRAEARRGADAGRAVLRDQRLRARRGK